MERTHYTVKAKRARKAWKRLKEQTQTKATGQTIIQVDGPMEYKLPEITHDA